MQAFEAFATGFRKYPDDLETQTRLALFMLTLLASGHNGRGEIERAIQIWNGFLQIQPENAYIGSELGLSLLRLGDFNQARSHLVRVLDASSPQERSVLLAQVKAIVKTSAGMPEAMSQRFFHSEALIREASDAGLDFRDIATQELSTGTPVLIAGMHRSGTSMVTRIAAELGVHLGPSNQLVSAGPDNVEGYFENTPITQLNQDLLRHLGGGWDAPPRRDTFVVNDPAIAAMKSRAMLLAAGIAVGRGDAPAWGWKDPRNSLLLPFWLDVLPNARLVIVFRSPGAVAESLLRRGGNHTREFGLRLWLEYYESIFSSVNPASTLFVDYEEFFEAPTAQIARLVAYLRLASTDESISAASSYVSKTLRHNARTEDWKSSGLAGEVMPVYQRLLELSSA